ncbi:flagellar protein FliT [Paraburkholderia sp. DHOC27]|uniref:flagellar protein FliT n=1 Tax=Paraburkholderia sp. DHOC27 TaxID=2303330 RepID=UPI000E3C365E|nr:flagellar protein FliT [Paraburkholderia sp. DHOC27]RFU47466.1 flagellar protein FliT [Paraburkholderia sp. DHOC27]
MDQTQLVERVFEMTQAIAEAGQIADWQKAARLAQERSPLVRSIQREQAPVALAMIRRIQAMDRSLIDDARTTQAELTAEYELATRRIKSAQQYNRVAMF